METSLYLPVKRFLEARGFAVKGEVCGCDLVAVPAAAGTGANGAGAPAANGGEADPPLLVIGELKQRFSLELLLQGVDRMAAGDEIWLAVRSSGSGGRRGRGRERDPRVRKLCRLLGFGLLGVSGRGQVEVLAEPGPWRPRKVKRRRARLVDEHRRRRGDPAVGGGTRQPIMTAYRQQALAVAAALAADTATGAGARRPRDLKAVAPDAPKILLHNVYGWFVRVERGVYGLTEAGRAALVRWEG
ncbi:MAG: DUF2161 family putative PD-(D/E)XK-type phosphodiesterase [Dongiaceae bacterium]